MNILSSIKLSLIILGMLIITAFKPILQVTLLLINSMILYPLGYKLGVEVRINTAISILILALFFHSKNSVISRLLGITSIIFLFPIFTYFAGDSFTIDESGLFQRLISGVLTGVTLLLIEHFKKRSQSVKHT